MKRLVASCIIAAAAAFARADIRAVSAQTPSSARTLKWWTPRHESALASITNRDVQLVFLGDSITHGWRLPKDRCLNLGFNGDRTEHLLWRITEGGELDGYQAKFVSVLIGSNNTGHFSEFEEPPADTILGVCKVLQTVLAKQTNAVIVLNALFPRGTNATNACRLRNDVVNREIRKFADGRRIFWVDIADRFLEKDGTLPKTLFKDALHPTAEGYKIWKEELKPYVDYALSDRSGPAPKHRESNHFVAARANAPREATPKSRISPWTDGPADCWWTERLLAKRNEIAASGGKFDVVLLGDSITHGWEKAGGEALAQMRTDRTVLDIGYGGDSTQHLLWRIENGELAGYRAKMIVLMIGTNNSGAPGRHRETALAVRRILDVIAAKQPSAKVLLLPIFPRGANAADPKRIFCEKVNDIIRGYADGKRVLWLDFNSKFLDERGDVAWCMKDRLHPGAEAYRDIWLAAMEPFFAGLNPAPISAANAATKPSDLIVGSNDFVWQTGDSISAYGRDHGVQKLVPMALAAIGVTPKWHTEAYGGRVSREVLAELPKAIAEKPTVLLVQCGINDVNHVKGKEEFEDLAGNLEKIWSAAEAIGARPVQVGMVQEKVGAARGWPERVKRLCESRARPVAYCDVAAEMIPVFDDPTVPTVPNRSFTKQTLDGIHPNTFGYMQMSWAVLKALGFKDEDRGRVYALWEEFNSKNK